VTLKAHSAVGITATFVRIGKGPARAYRGPFLIKASQLKSLRFESVDRFGYWERPQRVHR
jgi:hypothetical protein